MRFAINTISNLGIQTAACSAKLIVRIAIDSSAAYSRLSLRSASLHLSGQHWRQLASELAAIVGVMTPVTGGVCFATAKQRPTQATKRCVAAG